MSKSNDIKCVFTGNQHEVLILKSILEKEGVSSIIKNDYESGISAGFYGGLKSTIELFIKEIDIDRASPLIEDFSKQSE